MNLQTEGHVHKTEDSICEVLIINKSSMSFNEIKEHAIKLIKESL